MGKTNDTIKVKLVTDKFSVIDKKDSIIIIEQKEKTKENKSFIEGSVFTILIIPLIVLILSIFINRALNWRKEKRDGIKVQNEIDKLIEEREKIKEETAQIKKSFQPIVLTTLMQSQEFYRGDKVKALKEIVNFRTDLFYVEQFYHEGELVIDDIFEYYSSIYRSISHQKANKLNNIVNEFGYLFPDIVINKLKDLQSSISDLNRIWAREASIQNDQMPNDAEIIMKKLSDKFDKVVELIRKDLYVDNGFINEFIQEYKRINE